MFIVYEAFDDNTAIIADLSNYAQKEFSEQQLIRLASNHEVLGLSVSGQKINYLNAYSCIAFTTESEADEYLRDNGLSYQHKRYVNNMFWVLEKKNQKTHVDYYVYSQAGPDLTYIGKDGGYTPYIQAAKTFTKREANEKAVFMTKRSKTGKHWCAKRVVKRFM